MKNIILCAAVFAIGGSVSAQSSTETVPSAPAPAASADQGQTQWLVGRWVFDDAYTKSKQEQAAANRNTEAGPAGNATAQMLEKMNGASLAITASEITTTLPDRGARTFGYVVVPGTDANTARLKQGNGEELTIYREGDRIWMQADGSVAAAFYFRKAE
jgi:hypothetical protein